MGGDGEWLRGLEFAPTKVQALAEINALLARQPWKISKGHIQSLVKHQWSVAELVHAIIIMNTFHASEGSAAEGNRLSPAPLTARGRSLGRVLCRGHHAGDRSQGATAPAAIADVAAQIPTDEKSEQEAGPPQSSSTPVGPNAPTPYAGTEGDEKGELAAAVLVTPLVSIPPAADTDLSLAEALRNFAVRGADARKGSALMHCSVLRFQQRMTT